MFRRTKNHAWTHPDGTVTRGKKAPSVYCDCGYPMAGKVVRGTLNDSVACNANCTGAVGHDCECSCGGANHGADHS